MRSKITSKYQITIPRAVRQKLRLKENDAIEWKFEDGRIFVENVEKPFIEMKGIIRTGRGDIQKDIREARKKRADQHR